MLVDGVYVFCVFSRRSVNWHAGNEVYQRQQYSGGGLFVRCHEVTDKENSFPLNFVYCPHEVNFEHTIKRQPQSFK